MFSGSKPTFGMATPTPLGFNNQQQQQQASPFGSSFARPATTTGFGAPQQQNTSLFGAQPQAAGGMFGSPTTATSFGAPQTAPQQGFSGEF